jgi:TonB family protein
MKIQVINLMLMLFAFTSYAQSVSKIDSNAQHISDQSNQKYINGKVVLRFIVERDGSLSDIKVIKSLTPQLDSLAVQRLKTSPKWKPATLNGRPIMIYFTFPIEFTGYKRKG